MIVTYFVTLMMKSRTHAEKDIKIGITTRKSGYAPNKKLITEVLT